MDVRIEFWHYDEGYPFGYPESYDAEDFREPAWVCHVYMKSGSRIIQSWLEDNCTGSCDWEWRFNSGNPYLCVRISKEEDATAFLLTWQGR